MLYRRAAVSEHGLRPYGATVVGEHRLVECRLLTKRFSRLWRAALRHDDCSLFGRQNAEIPISVNVDGFIGLCGRCWCLPGAGCARNRDDCPSEHELVALIIKDQFRLSLAGRLTHSAVAETCTDRQPATIKEKQTLGRELMPDS